MSRELEELSERLEESGGATAAQVSALTISLLNGIHKAKICAYEKRFA